MSRSRWIAVPAVVAVAMAFLWWKSGQKPAAPKYRTAALERGDVTASVSATGTVRPVVQVAVGSQVSGTLAKLHVDYNARVKAGQVLCELDPSSFHARLVQAQASVARAEAGLKDGDRQLKRANELFAQNFISQTEVEAAQVTVDQRKADLLQAKATLEAAQVDLDHTVIRSPIDGVVISRSIDVGQTVAASLQAPQLFVIANDLTQMQVESRIDEADIGRIVPNLAATFTVDAFPDAQFTGKVSQVRLEPITDQNVVTYTTVIRTANDDLRLRPGMTANVTVNIETRTNVLKVSNSALRFKPDAGGNGANAGARGGPNRGANSSGARDSSGAKRGGAKPDGYKHGSVYVLRDGKPVKIDVRTGITDGNMTEIVTDELHEADMVIVGLELVASKGSSLSPPPGMGGPMGGRPGGAGGRR